jgi:hypothetical protein
MYIKYSEYNFPVVVTEQSLKFLHSFLERNFDTINYSIYCSDSTNITFSNLDELIQYENPKFKSIESIIIESSCTNSSLYICFGGEKTYKAMKISSTVITRYECKNLNDGIYMDKELTDRINELRAKFSCLTKWNYTFMFPIVIFASSLLINYYVIIKRIIDHIPVSNNSLLNSSETLVMVIPIISIVYLLGYFLEKVKCYLFPHVSFLLGKQKEEYKSLIEKRRIIFIYILLTLVVGILSSLLIKVIWS